MADEEEINIFSDISRNIAMKAFPQLRGVFKAMDTVSDYMSNKDKIKDMPKNDADSSDEDEDPPKRRRKSNVEIDITPITDGLDILHTDISQGTNIILNLMREDQVRLIKLIEKMSGDGNVFGTGSGTGSENGSESPLRKAEESVEKQAEKSFLKKILPLVSEIAGSTVVAGGGAGLTMIGANELVGKIATNTSNEDEILKKFRSTNDVEYRNHLVEEAREQKYEAKHSAAGPFVNLYDKATGNEDQKLDSIKKDQLDLSKFSSKEDSISLLIKSVDDRLKISSISKEEKLALENKKDYLQSRLVSLQEESNKLQEKIATDQENYIKDVKTTISSDSNLKSGTGSTTPETQALYNKLGINSSPENPDGTNKFTTSDIARRRAEEQRTEPLSPHVPGSAPSNNGTSTRATGDLLKNQGTATEAFKKLGYDDDTTRAIVATLSGESLKNPSDTHKDPSQSNPNQMAHGIASWDDERSSDIEKQFGKKPNELSLDKQAEALDWEIKNKFPKLYKTLQDPTVSKEQKLHDLIYDFEKPADKAGEYNKRLGMMNGLGNDNHEQGEKFGKPDLGFGDSTVHGLKLPGDSVEGRSPKDSLAAVKEYLKNNDVKGKSVVVSGVSNDTSEAGLEAVRQQVQLLTKAGAKVDVMGGGTRADIAAMNPRLEKMAKEEGALFTPMGPTTNGSLPGTNGPNDKGMMGVHPDSYSKQLEAISNTPTGRASENFSGDPSKVLDHLFEAKNKGLITNDDCVSLASAAVGIRMQNGTEGDPKKWVRAGEIGKDTAAGTPIMTTLDKNYQPDAEGRYAGGTGGQRGMRKDHAAVMIGRTKTDKDGNVISAEVADQYAGNGFHGQTHWIDKTGPAGTPGRRADGSEDYELNLANYGLIGTQDAQGNKNLLGGNKNPEQIRRNNAAKKQEEPATSFVRPKPKSENPFEVLDHQAQAAKINNQGSLLAQKLVASSEHSHEARDEKSKAMTIQQNINNSTTHHNNVKEESKARVPFSSAPSTDRIAKLFGSSSIPLVALQKGF